MRVHLRAGLPVTLLLVLGSPFLSPLTVQAQGDTAYDLINAVNSLRALHGLPPYTVDPGLMAYAQEHSAYQAATRTSTHIHSDGVRAIDIGLQENVAAGTPGFVTADAVVYTIWADWGHRHILTGYATGEIGAGTALSDDGLVYYTVDVRTGEELAATEAPFVGLQTSTPRPDGSVAHVVGYGQTLWSIAVSYGVTIDDIRRLNNLSGDSVVIQPGQELVIRIAGEITPASPEQTTSTPTEPSLASATAITATAFPTEADVAAPSATAFAEPAVGRRQSRTGVLIAVGIGIVGLSIAAAIGFMQARNDRGSPG
jgi:uncharacterized protein YkwD